MNRATRDKLAKGTGADLTSGNACWETAPLVYAQLAEDFGPFDIDLTGDAERALCGMWFGPGSPVGQEDALAAEWYLYGANGYSNPPYGRFVQHVLRKAIEESALGFRSTLLLPLRITRAFKRYVLAGASDLIFPDRRLVFFENGIPRCTPGPKGKLRADTALFDSIIVRYGPDAPAAPRIGMWKVPPHVTKDDIARAELRRAA